MRLANALISDVLGLEITSFEVLQQKGLETIVSSPFIEICITFDMNV